MANEKIVWGIEIILTDAAAPIVTTSELTALGYYNRSALLTSNAAADQRNVVVAIGHQMRVGDLVSIDDTGGTAENNSIASITAATPDVDHDTLVMAADLARQYNTAATATVVAGSAFRWVQNNTASITGWTSGVIAENGLSRWRRSINLDSGGAIADPAEIEVTVNNTTKLWYEMLSNGIFLTGCVGRLYSFSNTTATVKMTGKCDTAGWDAKQYKIKIAQNPQDRVANILTKCTNTVDGNELTILAQFGEFKPSFDSENNIDKRNYAKIGIFAHEEKEWIASNSPSWTNMIPANVKIYYVSAKSTSRIYQLWLGNDSDLGADSISSEIVGSYLLIVEGANTGKYRKITAAAIASSSGVPIITITIESYYPVDIAVGNWVKIIKLNKQYNLDSWPCKAFIDNEGNTLNQNNEIYAYDNKLFYRIPQDIYKLIAVADNNQLEINYEAFNNNPNNIEASIIEKPTINRLINDTDYGVIDTPVVAYGPFKREIDGYYIGTTGISVSGISSDITNDPDNADKLFDVDNTTLVNENYSALNSAGVGNTRAVMFGINFHLPSYPDDFEADHVYFLLKLTVNSTAILQTIRQYLLIHRFPGSIEAVNIEDVNKASVASILSDNFPDWYFDPSLSTGNKNFYQGPIADNRTSVLAYTAASGQKYVIVTGNIFLIGDNVTISGPGVSETNSIDSISYNTPSSGLDTLEMNSNLLHLYPATTSSVTSKPASVTGYLAFELAGYNTKDLYDIITDIYFIVITNHLNATPTDITQAFNQFAVLFLKELTIKEELYTPFQGRIYNDTWNARVTAADMMETPRKLFEAICRWQRYDGISQMPTAGWGLGYANNALIKTSGDGSFDATDAEITVLDSYRCTRRIDNYDDGYTDKLKLSICRDFQLASWVDATGYECIKRVKKYSDTTGLDALTLADIVDRTAIRVDEAAASNIYCEPFVRYNIHPSTEKPQSQIIIKNVSALTYSSAYVEGLSGTLAETYWTLCHNLYLKYRIINKPPQELTDLKWYNNIDYSEATAIDYLTTWIEWMHAKKITFPVAYDKIKTWDICQKFTLQLPHQTANDVTKCFCIGIEVNPNAPYDATITALTFDTVPDDFMIVETIILFGNDTDDWQETMDINDDNLQEVY